MIYDTSHAVRSDRHPLPLDHPQVSEGEVNGPKLQDINMRGELGLRTTDQLRGGA